MNKKHLIIVVLLVFVLVFEFLYLNPLGIKIGYMISGGYRNNPQSEEMQEEVLREYNEQVRLYEMYKNDENRTAKKWSDNAKKKANELADKYNSIYNEETLKIIGD